MTERKAGMLWLCHVCDRKFPETEGAPCGECYRSTCSACFAVQNGEPRVCRVCAEEREDPEA